MRTVGSVGELTQARIYGAAARLIGIHGFEAVSLREIAATVGLQVGSLYNHISSKQDLLFNILHAAMKDAVEGMNAQVTPIDNPIDALRAFVRFHIAFHTERISEAVIATQELRSLSSANRKRILALRDEYDAGLRKILRAGCKSGAFAIENVQLCEYAIIAMLSGISWWFNPRGALSRDALTSQFEGLCLRLVGAPASVLGADKSRPEPDGQVLKFTRKKRA